MNHPPLEILPSIRFEDNRYFCSDLRDAANYVKSFHVHFTLTTNITRKIKDELVANIFSSLFPRVKEVTAFIDSRAAVSLEDLGANWSYHKDRIRAKNPTECKDDFSELWFNAKTALMIDKDDFISSDFFSQCNDPAVLLNPRTGHGNAMWNYVRYRVDKHELVGICTDYYDVSNQSNAALCRPHISIVAKGTNLDSLLGDAFTYCKVTNHHATKDGKLFYLRIGRVRLNESHFRKLGKDLLFGYVDVIVERLRTALKDKGLLITLCAKPVNIEFEYRPEAWDEYLSVIRKELRGLNVPGSTRIVDNRHPSATTEYEVYDE